ncbi:DUF6691 family protein [Aureivirga marina]|uniref:DUF6691 family protein n=1 Tax=Aureivirga marina TaxID=1182451 RepID=UPI0018CB35E2|nr:DUF6691 family protein [Aureivirga marina]
MKNIKFLILGILFGIILIKGEVASWYRIFEMFKFQSFHMYGVIGVAIVSGIIIIQLFKKRVIKDYSGNEIKIEPKKPGFKRTFIGGISFGLGWALVGACPAPMFALIGQNFLAISIVIIGALLGTFTYGVSKSKLPH